MKIIVCVKQVPHPDIVRFDLATNTVEDVIYMINPYDRVALEEAIRIRDKLGDGEVTVITLGPPEAEKVLRSCLAMGADKAILLSDDSFKNFDAYATSVALANAISKLSYDLIMCGKMSIDECNGYVGAGIAESLKLPHVPAITKLEISSDKKKASISRRVANIDREVIECPLPAVFTVDEELNEPRYISITKTLSANQKEITKLDAKSLGVEPGSIKPMVEVLSYSQPKPRLKKGGVAAKGPSANLSAHERMKMLMKGGSKDSKSGGSSKIVEKPPEAAASDIVQFLINNRIIESCS